MRAWILVAVALLVSGCAGTTQPRADPEVPVFSTPAPPGEAEGRAVPESCAEVVTPEEIGTVLGILIGEPRPVVGVAQDDIGRTARLDCYYGVPKGKPLSAASVWIGLAGYTDEHWAQRRVSNTVTGERDAGARVSDVPVGPDRGVLLRGTTWMLVAARGSTTVVVEVEPNLVREDRVGAMLGQLADRALTPPG